MNDGNKRRPRVLLGITGSVAAVKGPELAVRLLREVNVDVRVLLTSGGFNFWNKARDYDQLYWSELEKHISLDSGDAAEGTIVIHSECAAHCCCFLPVEMVRGKTHTLDLFLSSFCIVFRSCRRRVEGMASTG